MARVELKMGDFGLTVEGNEEQITAKFEKLLRLMAEEFPSSLPRPQTKTATAKPKKATKTKAARRPGRPKKKVTGKAKKLARGRTSKKTAGVVKKASVASATKKAGTFKEHPKYSNKLSQAKEILVFADWHGGSFRSKDYVNALKEAGVFTEKKKKNFQGNTAQLKKAGRIRKVRRGLVRITPKGREYVATKIKK